MRARFFPLCSLLLLRNSMDFHSTYQEITPYCCSGIWSERSEHINKGEGSICCCAILCTQLDASATCPSYQKRPMSTYKDFPCLQSTQPVSCRIHPSMKIAQ